MKCPVCDRSLAPTLSICPSCGAMMNDTVREEVQSNIIRGPAARAVATSRTSTAAAVAMRPEMTAPAHRPALDPPLAPPPKRVETTELVAPKTSPTLVDFQNKATTVPDWRLQMQNAVQQRRKATGGNSEVTAPAAAVAVAAKVEAAP